MPDNAKIGKFMRKKIVVTGSLAYDYIFDFPGKFSDNIDPTKLHILNLSFLVTDLRKGAGGTAGNIAYSLGLLGVQTKLLAVAGNDFDTHRKHLEKAGVETAQIKIIPDESTALAMIMTDAVDNQIAAFYPGAMNHSPELTLNTISEHIDFLIIAPDLPETMIQLTKEAAQKKIPYLFDPGMQLPRLSDSELKEGIKGTSILIGNDYEMGLMIKRVGEERIQNVPLVITTLGEKGSIISEGDKKIEIKPSSPESVVDPTGAGDAYRSGFMAGFLDGKDLKTCGQMGSLAACYSVEKYGTTTHYFTQEEFKNRYQKNYHEEL